MFTVCTERQNPWNCQALLPILRGGRPDSRRCQDHPTSRRQECRLRQRCLTTINTRINQYLNPAGALGIRRGRSWCRELPWYAENPSLHQCKRVHVDQSHTLIRGSNPSRKVATPTHLPYPLHVPEQTKFNPKVSLSPALVYKVRLGLLGVQYSVCHRRCTLIMPPIFSILHNLVST